MKRFAAISLLPLLLLTVPSPAQGTLEEDLVRLDNTLEMAGDFVSNHEARTAALRSLLDSRDLSPAEAFDLYGQLFRAEFTYRFDNAMEAADRKLEAASALKDKAKMSEANVDRAMLFCIAGMYLEAMQASAQIDTSCLSGAPLIQYYNFQQRFFYDFREYTRNDGESDSLPEKVRYYRRRIIDETGPDDPLHQLMTVRELIDEGGLAAADSLGTMFLAGMDPYSHEFAELAYYEATICRDLGRQEEMMGWFARSAVGDIRSATKDNGSLQSLAVELLNSGRDIDRAFRYTQFSLDDALFFNARLRPWQIAQSLPAIENAYNSSRAAQERQTRRLNIALLVLALVLLAALTVLLVIYARQRRIQKQVREVNTRLQAAMSDLSQANAAKEEYLGLFLTMCSSYIDKLKKFMTMSQIDAELRNFYKTFDNAFLQLYPDFVEKFNALLVPEARIELKKDELLNTELRIFAVIKLGITQSSHIATLLRYSVNTIYNYRAQVKNAAIDGKENFEERVKAI
jgi:hypothetical protein